MTKLFSKPFAIVLALFSFFLYTPSWAQMTLVCKLYEDHPKPIGLREITVLPPVAFSLKQTSLPTLNTAAVAIPSALAEHGFSGRVELTEVIRSHGVVWEGKILTVVNGSTKRSSTCFYKGLGYHLFEGPNGQELALHCQINAILDQRDPVEKMRADLLEGNPAEHCVRAGTSSTSGSRYPF